jgi:hypothetical protein
VNSAQATRQQRARAKLGRLFAILGPVYLYGGILVNAAILLVSSAWMAGQTPDVIIPVQHAQPAACGNNCCNDSCHQGICAKLRERCRGLFQRDHCDSCSQPRCQTFHHCERQHCERQHCERPHHERCCQSHNACDSCGHTSLLERIRNAFHRDRCCDNGCCNSTSGSAPGAEPLKDQPKKMPTKEKTKAEEARVITTPGQAPLPAIENAPAIQSAPALAPRTLENDNRNPF